MSASNPQNMADTARIPAAADAAAARGPGADSPPVAGAAALDELIREHGPRLTRLVWRLFGWRTDVDDVVQEVFVQAWQHMAEFRGASRVETWLARIAINACRARLRRQRLWLGFLRRPERLDQAARLAPAAEHPLHEDETGVRVRTAVAALPAALREVIVLRYLEELSIEDVASVTGLSRGAVDVRLTRARRQLKETLADVWEQAE